MRKSRADLHALACLVIAACAYESARADAISDFYTGRTVNMIIGSAPGGSYDLYAAERDEKRVAILETLNRDPGARST